MTQSPAVIIKRRRKKCLPIHKFAIFVISLAKQKVAAWLPNLWESAFCNLSIEEQDQIKTQKFCSSCGKPIGSRRKGSMTQFIFSQGQCDCDRPVPVMVDQPSSSSSDTSSDDEKLTEQELELDPDSFPLDRYKPIRELGRGAAGCVYLSRDRLLKNLVAVKTLLQISGEQLIAFQNEARSTSNLKAQGIVQIIDFGATASGAPYMVMEYIEGSSLADLIAHEGTLKVRQALTISAKAAQALSHAHDHNVFHRDIKPTNILLSEENKEVKIIDFGIAKIIDTGKFKQGDTIVGTPFYLSPDVSRGLEYSARSEIYSLACVLFEMLSGKPPFVGESALETISLHATATIPEISGVSYSINEFIQSGLAKDPKERPPSMKEFARRANELLSQESQILEAVIDQGNELTSPQPPEKPRYPTNFNLFLRVIGVLTILLAIASISYKTFKHSTTEKKVKPVELVEQDHETPTVFLMSAEDGENLDKKSSIEIKRDQITCKYISDSQLLEAIDKNPKIKWWRINHSKVTTSGLTHLKNVPLIWLSLLNCNRVDDQVFKELVKNPLLRRVSINRCHNLTPKVLVPLSASNVNELHLSKLNEISKWLETTARLKSLEGISLSNMSIEDNSLTPLIDLPKLRALNFKKLETKDDKWLAPLKEMKALNELTISETKIGKEALLIIARLPNLKSLNLKKTGLTAEQITSLKTSLKNCRIKDSSNQVNTTDYVEMLFTELR